MEKIRFQDDLQKKVFPVELQKQEEALASCEILSLFRRNREELVQSRWCPSYHLIAPAGYLHDPNGLCYWNGHWHLFYQHCYDTGSAEGLPGGENSICWGHVISDDLIHWKDLPDAIYPNPEKACWSGATLVEDDRVIAAYFGPGAGIMVAVSSDPLLLNWEKKGGIAIPFEDEQGNQAPSPLYDPCLFRKGEYYYLLSGLREYNAMCGRENRQEFLYRSKDLITWEYRHTFLEADEVSGKNHDGSCPYFIDIGTGTDRKQLLVHYCHASGSMYMLGKLDEEREKFHVITSGKFSPGNWMAGGLHAPSCHPYQSGDAVVLFNMNNAVPDGFPIMSLPQTMRLTGTEKDEIALDVVRGVYSLRGEHSCLGRRMLTAGELFVPEGIGGNCAEIRLEVKIPYQRALKFYLLRSDDGEEYTEISVHRNAGLICQDLVYQAQGFDYAQNTVVTLDTTQSTRNPQTAVRVPESCNVPLAKDETVVLDVFLDHGIIEVFVNGFASLIRRVYPDRSDSVGVALKAIGGDAELIALEKWEMKGIY